MQFRSQNSIDQSQSLVIVFDDPSALATCDTTVQKIAKRDAARFKGASHVHVYRHAYTAGGDLFLLFLGTKDRSNRALQKAFHSLAAPFLASSCETLQFAYLADLSEAQKLQSLKAFLLALPVYNPHSTSGYQPLKDTDSDGNDTATEPLQAGAGLAETLLKQANAFKLAADKQGHDLQTIAVVQDDALSDTLQRDLAALTSSIYLSRELINERANAMTPRVLADVAERVGSESGIEVEILNENEIAALGMEAFLSVAKGSDEPPRFIVMRYKGKPESDKTLALVGKGLMYDSGGYAIKPTASMYSMFSDMSGSAAVIGAIRALALTKAKVNVTAIVASCENMISGHAYRNGDIIGSMAGKTIEILNTDAEGRLTLADAVTYAWQKENADYIVDIATLTGAVVVALGDIMTAALADDETLWSAIEAASTQSGDLVWRLPFHEEFARLNKSDRADLKNSAGRGGGTITAGHFVRAFTGNTPFLHLDIAGTAYTDAAGDRKLKGASGVGVELLYDLAKELFKD